jgi:hypothetical protein
MNSNLVNQMKNHFCNARVRYHGTPNGKYCAKLAATRLDALVFYLVAGIALSQAAPPAVHPLAQGSWPAWSRGEAADVKVQGSYAYVAIGAGGLAVVDVSNPTNCVRVGGFDTVGSAEGVAVLGNHAYVAD